MKGTKWMILLCAAMLSCGMTVSAAPFDPAYYAAQNPDVVQAVGEDEAALELHYSTFGAAEGRAANAQEAADRSAAARNAKTPVSFEEFDPAYYAEQNPDVTALLGTDPSALYAHYVLFGAAEGRLPKAPEVVDPYARFASSDSGSRSSRHSDDDDDDNSSSTGSGSGSGSGSSSGSGSAQEHIVYAPPRYEKDTQTADSHFVYYCSIANCRETGHGRKFEWCSGASSVVDDDKHHIVCDKCGRDQDVSHSISTNPVTGAKKHRRECSVCNYKGPEEPCDFERRGYSSRKGVCWASCRVCSDQINYEHTEDDWDDNGKCKLSDQCQATRSNPFPNGK